MHDIIEISSIEEPKFETSIIHGEDFVDAARLLGGNGNRMAILRNGGDSQQCIKRE